VVNKLAYVIAGVDRPLLQGVTFTLEPGTALGILGSSGSGKSTLARLIAGCWQPYSGEVRRTAARSGWTALISGNGRVSDWGTMWAICRRMSNCSLEPWRKKSPALTLPLLNPS